MRYFLVILPILFKIHMCYAYLNFFIHANESLSLLGKLILHAYYFKNVCFA